MHSSYTVLFSFLLLLFTSGRLAATPSITSISPNTGPGSGGTTVTILGAGFSTATGVSFDNTPATSYMIVSDSEITATSPPHVPQTISLSVLSGSGNSSSYYVYQGNWQIYVANGNDGTVSIIDPVTNLVGSPISVGNNPCNIVFTPDGQKALVTNEADNTLTFINALTQATLDTVSTEGIFPDAMVVAPNGSAVYVVNNTDGTISAFNTATFSSLWTYPTGGNPSTLAITPDGSLLGVTDTATNEVIFLTSAGALNNQCDTASSQDCIVLDATNTTAYIANTTSQSISVMSPYTGTTSSSITVGNNPTAITLTPDSSNLYVVNATDDTVSVIDTTSQLVTQTISVGTFPKNIMITGTQGYVTNNTSGSVSVINTTNYATSTISTGIGSNPYAMGVLPDGSKVYVGNSGSASVSIIQTTNNTVIATPSVGLFPCSIAITPDQAPLAMFSYQVGGSGKLVTFDASASASPTGTISTYSWNFGDGATLETAGATTSHSYTSNGTFEVVLTVTNSAGTSTEQIFNHASSRNFNLQSLAVAQSETISNNGGPSATTTQSVAISMSGPLPPTNLKGSAVKNQFLTEADRINILTWNAPQGGTAVKLYCIFRNRSLTDFAGSVWANETLEFLDHDRRRHVVYTYYVVSVRSIRKCINTGQYYS